MHFYSKKKFWGYVFLILGGLLFFNKILGISIFFFTALLSLLLIWLGIKLLSGDKNIPSEDSDIILRKGSFGSSNHKEYTTLLGKGLLDLTEIFIEETTITKTQNTLLGSTTIHPLDKHPIRIAVSCVAGEIVLPNKVTLNFGDREYTTTSYDKSKPHLFLKVLVVLGEVTITAK